MSEITNYSGLERFWVSLEQEFFQRMDNMMKKAGIDLEKEEEKVHSLKEMISNTMIRRFNALCDELKFGSLTHKYVRDKFAGLENLSQVEVNKFIVNWLNDGAW